MRGDRLFGAALGMFALGVAVAAVGLGRYQDAYGSVAHTSDVRLVIGRAIGHAGRAAHCDDLRADLDELTELTHDNPIQVARLPAVRAGVDAVCWQQPAPGLVDELSALDATERALLIDRRARLAAAGTWVLAAFVGAMLAAMGLVAISRRRERRSRLALADSEEQFRMLASHATDLIRIHDAAGRPLYVSPSVERLLGYTPAELIAMAPIVSLGHPDDLARMQASLVRIREPGAPASTLVYRLRAKDGAYRWFETHTDPVRDDAGALVRFYTTARDVTERVEAERKLERISVTDELTGLLNRRGFAMMAGQEHRIAIRQKLGVAVVFADLDGLKRINDQLGHEQGDAAIRAIGEILRTTFRESDVVARLGGDEFAALAYDVDRAGIDAVVARIREAVAASPSGLPLAVSLGVAVLEPGAGRPLDDLIAEADAQMYEDKRSRRRGPGDVS